MGGDRQGQFIQALAAREEQLNFMSERSPSGGQAMLIRVHLLVLDNGNTYQLMLVHMPSHFQIMLW